MTTRAFRAALTATVTWAVMQCGGAGAQPLVLKSVSQFPGQPVACPAGGALAPESQRAGPFTSITAIARPVSVNAQSVSARRVGKDLALVVRNLWVTSMERQAAPAALRQMTFHFERSVRCPKNYGGPRPCTEPIGLVVARGFELAPLAGEAAYLNPIAIIASGLGETCTAGNCLVTLEVQTSMGGGRSAQPATLLFLDHPSEAAVRKLAAMKPAEHWDVFRNLAVADMRAGRHEDAIRNFAQAIDAARRHLGESHATVARLWHESQRPLRAAKRAQELESTLKNVERLLAPLAPERIAQETDASWMFMLARARADLAQQIYLANRYEEAATYYRLAYCADRDAATRGGPTNTWSNGARYLTWFAASRCRLGDARGAGEALANVPRELEAVEKKVGYPQGTAWFRQEITRDAGYWDALIAAGCRR